MTTAHHSIFVDLVSWRLCLGGTELSDHIPHEHCCLLCGFDELQSYHAVISESLSIGVLPNYSGDSADLSSERASLSTSNILAALLCLDLNHPELQIKSSNSNCKQHNSFLIISKPGPIVDHAILLTALDTKSSERRLCLAVQCSIVIMTKPSVSFD